MNMRTGEKIAFLRKKKGLTQEQMAEILEVSRQSVSRWEIDMAFPETEKLIKLSRLLECSVDYLLNVGEQEAVSEQAVTSLDGAYRFIRSCGYFFLATDAGNKPNQRPMGMLYCDGKTLYIGTDRRKQVFSEILENASVSLVSYNQRTRRWIRIAGEAYPETAIDVYQAMQDCFPTIRQNYTGEEEIYFAVLRLTISCIQIE